MAHFEGAAAASVTFEVADYSQGAALAVRPTLCQVRNAFNRVLDTADLYRRGPDQMRHTFACLLLQNNVPATYVSRQLGHRDVKQRFAGLCADAIREMCDDQLEVAVPFAGVLPPRAGGEVNSKGLFLRAPVLKRAGVRQHVASDRGGCNGGPM